MFTIAASCVYADACLLEVTSHLFLWPPCTHLHLTLHTPRNYLDMLRTLSRTALDQAFLVCQKLTGKDHGFLAGPSRAHNSTSLPLDRHGGYGHQNHSYDMRRTQVCDYQLFWCRNSHSRHILVSTICKQHNDITTITWIRTCKSWISASPVSLMCFFPHRTLDLLIYYVLVKSTTTCSLNWKLSSMYHNLIIIRYHLNSQ